MLLYATSTLRAAACSPASKSVTFSCDVLVLRRMLLQLRLPLQERTESDPLAEAEHIKEEIDALEEELKNGNSSTTGAPSTSTTTAKPKKLSTTVARKTSAANVSAASAAATNKTVAAAAPASKAAPTNASTAKETVNSTASSKNSTAPTKTSNNTAKGNSSVSVSKAGSTIGAGAKATENATKGNTSGSTAAAPKAASKSPAKEAPGGKKLLHMTSRELQEPPEPEGPVKAIENVIGGLVAGVTSNATTTTGDITEEAPNTGKAVEKAIGFVSTTAAALVEMKEATGNTDLQFIHVPCTFGHTVEESGIGGHLDLPVIAAILESDIDTWKNDKEAAFQKLSGAAGAGAMLWGELNPDLRAISEETGCNLFYTPPSMWPADVAERQLQGKQAFSLLRDPYDRMANEFRMQCQGIDSAFLLVSRHAVSAREGHMEREGDEYKRFYETCDVNGYLQKELTQVLAGDRYRTNCHLLPSADYESTPYGKVEWIDERGIPESFNDFMSSKNATPRVEPGQALEIPMAGGALSVAVLSLVYEGIGIAWLPLLGPAIQEMFKGTPDSYYPRHGTAMDGTKAADEPAYTMLHHGTPGISACMACSEQLARKMFASKLASYPPQLGRNGLWLSKIYASFHTTIALHHLLYSMLGPNRYGKLELHRVGMGQHYGYAVTLVSSLFCLAYALRLLLGTSATTPAAEVLRVKTVLDTAAVGTVLEMAVFVPAIMADWPVPEHIVQWTWRLTMSSIPLIFVVDSLAA
ncbi:unnamed protein product [Symbiodinium microadriaticum]|nr:unnamed protein product [Symbiodinium microadriaticum]